MNHPAIFPTLLLVCPHCRIKLDVRLPIGEDRLVLCAACNRVSELCRGISGWSLVQSAPQGQS